MVALLQSYGILVFIVAIIIIPWLIQGITWIFTTIKKKKAADAALIAQGRAEEAKERALQERLEAGAKRMEKLDLMLERQQKQIDLLIQSDELDIKAYITEQYKIHIIKKCIDAETMDILERRFAIYTQEGGNGFAARMMEELRKLPIVSRD